MTRHVVGVFGDLDRAQGAVEALLAEGVPQDCVTALRWEDSGHGEKLLEFDQEERAEAINEGLKSGGALGALAGLLAGAIGLVTAPAGGIIVLGALSAALGGATIGATVGGFAGSLTNLGLSRETADRLIERLEAGATVVAVTTPTAEAHAMEERLQAMGSEETHIA